MHAGVYCMAPQPFTWLVFIVIQNAVTPKNGVEFGQKSIGAIRCSVARLCDNIRHTATSDVMQLSATSTTASIFSQNLVSWKTDGQKPSFEEAGYALKYGNQWPSGLYAIEHINVN